ncbi:asparaginase domain-containing protein [Ruminococcus sp.]|uniref:asparaginase domain-containing protein n=1 Tax=Ruminococcus sp. TaxID=41978 RepID=UPI00386B3D3F
MKVLLIMTGGTIGSSFDGGSINVRTDGKSAVVDHYISEHGDVRFDTVHPLNILSERITCDDFNTLAKALFDIDFFAYDGVIVTAGSDSLAYLSSFVGLLLGDCPIPVMIVAANKILTAPDSNGYVNFSCAVDLIGQGTRGVLAPYRNTDGVLYVHAATDLRQADFCDDFDSFHGAYGVFKNGALHEKRPYIAQHIPQVFDRDHLPQLSDNVLQLTPYPMQDYTRIGTDGVRAVLHTLYHSATLDADHFVPWMKAHPELPVFLAPLHSGRKRYQTTVDTINAGAIPLCDIAPECAYMKLLLACAQVEMTITAFMG